MNQYKEEIALRESIMQKSYEGIKITPEEREWLVTHPVYNWKLGFPFLNTSIENIEEKKWYLLQVNIESVTYEGRIVPVISVPAGKGKIIADFELTDIRGNVSKGKPVKMLAFGVDSTYLDSQVKYISTLGLLGVWYQCDYFDTAVNLHKRESSSTGKPNFAMTKQYVNDHKVRYRCKSPLEDSFDALIFTIEWTETLPLSGMRREMPSL